MHVRGSCLLLMLLAAPSADAQQTIYWKKDHIYAGPAGKEIAIVTPAPTDQTAPTAPAGLASSNITATSVQLSWSASTDAGGSNLAGYKIYRRVGTGASLPVGTVGPGTLSFTDQHLQPNTGYTFTIVAFDNAQNHSAASNSVSLTTLTASADATAPTIPTGLAASLAARTTVQLNWSPSTDIGGTGVAGYRVYRGGNLISGANLVTGLSYQDPNLSYKTAYSYTVVAVDNANNASAASAAASITTDWELVFQDEFSRPDSNNLNSSNWVSSGGWKVTATHANRSKNDGGGTVLNEAFTSSQTDFRSTVDLIENTNALDAGVMFWRSSGTPVSKYWISVSGGYIYFRYLDGASNQNILLGYVQFGGYTRFTGTVRVEASSATRNIKIYFDDALLINYTETDMSRPNSGYVGFWASFGFSAASVTFDNFILER